MEPALLRLGVLGARGSWYVQDLRRAAALRTQPTLIQLLSFGDLRVELNAGEPARVTTEQIFETPSPNDATPASNQVDCIRDFDAFIVRTMPLGSLEQVIFRMDCLQAIENSRPIINAPRTLEIAIDKWLTLHRLQLAGVPVPPTVACQTRDAALDACEQLGGDVLLKPLFGGEGRGIVRVQDLDMAWRACGTIAQLQQILYVQQFMDHLGYDIRVLLVGSKLFSIKRIGRDGAWRTNLSQGSRAERHELSDEERELALRAARAVTGDHAVRCESCVLGIDILPLRAGGYVVLEVNAVPGWKGLAATLEVDIAAEVIARIASCVEDAR